ncbi:MAG: class I SAM-dependent methyltransferase [Terrimicrobiaceae bacterium]
MTQDRFLECYRGGQGLLNHMAYLRLCKVFVTLEALRREDIDLDGKSVFDYAFGAGTFFRHCPASARLFGVELDSMTVREVGDALKLRGVEHFDLRPISLNRWREHPLLREKFDVVVCSHVLEHMDDPADLLAALGGCLAPNGRVIAIVPVNEIRANPHHVQIASQMALEKWAEAAGLRISDYFECDRIGWALQPLLSSEQGIAHFLARAASLSVGIPFATFGLGAWRCNDSALRILGVPASQACAVLGRD